MALYPMTACLCHLQSTADCMIAERAYTYLFGGNVGQIDSYTECSVSVVESELVDKATRAKLKAEGL